MENITNVQSQERKARVAVILSGGGAKGAFEVGVLKALRSVGIDPDIYSGTSVGAFNASMMVSGRSLADVEQVWTDLQTSDVFKVRYDPRQLLTADPRVPLELAISSARTFLNYLGSLPRHRWSWWRALDLDALLLDTSPLEELIRNNVNIDAVRVSSKKLFIALTRLQPVNHDALEIISNDRVTHQHIHASCAVPLIFPTVSIQDETFCDGGVVMNTPLKCAIDEGAEELYIIDLTPPPSRYEDATLSVAYQLVSLSFSEALQHDLRTALERNSQFLAAFRDGTLKDGRLEVKKLKEQEGHFEEVSKYYRYIRLYVLSPSSDLGGLEGFLDFRPDFAKELIREGERATGKTLRRCREKETTLVSTQDGSTLRVVLPD